MEQKHADYIEHLMASVKDGKPLFKLESSPEEDKFSERLEQQEINTENLESDLGDYSIVRMAYLIEKDFVDYYLKSAENQEENIKEVFLSLAEWEKQHAELMKSKLEMIIEKNSLDLGFYPF